MYADDIFFVHNHWVNRKQPQQQKKKNGQLFTLHLNLSSDI